VSARVGWRRALSALAELRFLLVRRRLRGKGGVAEGVAKVGLFAVAMPAAAAMAVGLGMATFQALRGGGGLWATVPVTGVFFGIWQAWTATALALGERDAVDLRRYLLYPLPPARVYALGLASGIAGDPFGAFWLVLLAGAFAGAALGRPGLWLLPLAALLATFAVATVALVALLQELLARLARWRWARELLIVAGVAGWLALAAGIRASGPALLPFLRKAQWALFPAALAAAAGRDLFLGRVVEALPWLAALTAAAAATGWLAYRLALSTARSGGDEGRGSTARGGVRLPRLLPERLGPLFEKELRYLSRHPVARVAMVVVPGLAAVLAWKLAPAIPAEAGEVVRALPLFGFALYVHLVLQIFWLNAFAWEGGGARTLFLAPVSPRAVLAAKNGAVALAAAGLFALGGAVYLAAGAAPPAWALLGAVALHLGLGPVLFGPGNLVSILNPRAATFALQRGAALPALSSLIGLAILSAAGALYGLPVLLALWLDSGWSLVAMWVAVGATAWLAWARTLPASGRLLGRRREALLAALSGDPG